MSEWIVEITDELPHLKLMTELVRCKDCKWYSDDYCCQFGDDYGDDWYCADGERREEDAKQS